MTVTMESLNTWLQGYVDAWSSNDAAAIEALFTQDAAYYPEPYDEPYRGGAEIAAAWLAQPEDPWRWAANYVPLIVAGEVGVATGTTTYYAEDGRVENVFHNLFVLSFADDGRCREYREWYMREPREEA